MKKFLYFTLFTAFLAAFVSTGCNKDCDGENPRARIINNGTAKADVQVQTTGGNTININNVLPSTSSSYSGFAAGTSTFTINVGKETKVTTLSMETCFDYDINIDTANNIITTPIKR